MSEPTDLQSALLALRASEAGRELSEAALRAQVAEFTAAVVQLRRQVATLLERASKKAAGTKPAATPDVAALTHPPTPDETDPALAGRPKPPEIPAEPEKIKQPVRPSGRRPVPEHLIVSPGDRDYASWT